MTYQETLTYLYNSAPLFQHVGKAAYKEGLENTLALDEYFGHPHRKFRTIHVAGTNGKGSCSHTLAAILQSAGYRVGLIPLHIWSTSANASASTESPFHKHSLSIL